MHFRHISAKIRLKNRKQHFDWGAGPPGLPLATPWIHCETGLFLGLKFLQRFKQKSGGKR